MFHGKRNAQRTYALLVQLFVIQAVSLIKTTANKYHTVVTGSEEVISMNTTKSTTLHQFLHFFFA